MSVHTKSSFFSFLYIVFVLVSGNAVADIKLPRLVGDGMVLQRDKQLPIWGWAEPGEEVSLLFRHQRATTQADATGKWMIVLDPLEAGGPYDMVLSGNNSIRLRDIMIGDVWICSGQSNMEWKLGLLKEKYATEIAGAKNPNIRLIEVGHHTSYSPSNDFGSEGWKVATPENVENFSAVAYFFAQHLFKQYNVPIGLIASSWGGTVAEAWMSEDGLKAFPEFADIIEARSSDKARAEIADYERELANWSNNIKKLEERNQKQEKKWAALKLNDKDWKSMMLPTLWESAGLKDFDGIVWFRKIIEVPKSMVGRDLLLSLGPIDDEDSTLFNGKLIGKTASYDAKRKYRVPANLVKAGKNVIAIKVVDTGGGGGIYGRSEEMVLFNENDSLPVHGEWKYKVSVDFSGRPENPFDPNQPGVLYNGMIAPLIPYAIRGVIWYQGESNTGRAQQYQTLFPTLIRDWRTQWGQGDFPFLFVQLANYMQPRETPGESSWAELREAQLKTLYLPHTGMAVTIDIGDAHDIHPKNKLDVGARLALAARKIAYKEDVSYSGPVYESMRIVGDTVRVRFKHVDGGLVAKDGGLQEFTIASTDKIFYRATAFIDNDEVVVYSDKVSNPVAVRYAWADNPEGANLYNKTGLPASPFRTDE